jgi:hypothetical protein
MTLGHYEKWNYANSDDLVKVSHKKSTIPIRCMSFILLIKRDDVFRG